MNSFLLGSSKKQARRFELFFQIYYDIVKLWGIDPETDFLGDLQAIIERMGELEKQE